MRLWDPSLSPTDPNGESSIKIHTTSSRHASLAVEFSGESMDYDEAIKRFVCHLFVAMMPTEGVEETMTSLGDAVDFYKTRQTTAVPRLSAATQSTGVVTTTEQLPALVISDE